MVVTFSPLLRSRGWNFLCSDACLDDATVYVGISPLFFSLVYFWKFITINGILGLIEESEM